MTAIAPQEIRYIKLGRGGRWARRALEEGELHFGYPDVPHALCRAGDWQAVADLLMAQGRGNGKAKDGVREIRDFYTLGGDCLWITFADGQLWWAFAEPEVTWLGDGGEAHGARMRKTRDGWHNADINGQALRMDSLSTRLTQTAAYRATICRIKDEGYLLRRINGEEEPLVVKARDARSGMLKAAGAMIKALHWADFETLVDLIFARSGWQRVSRVGETQADVDLVLEQPATGERAFVQVKSKATQSVLDDYLERYRRNGGYTRFFFICHSPAASLSVDGCDRLHVWVGDALADAAVRAGLFDWLMERVG